MPEARLQRTRDSYNAPLTEEEKFIVGELMSAIIDSTKTIKFDVAKAKKNA